jgi:bifunctional oligoribonuclease and PAP phosphatase NrnA
MKLKVKPGLKKRNPASSMSEVAKLIKSNQSFLITTHVNPDGDGLGAESALYLALKKLGKKVQVVNHDPLPKRFNYLPFASAYRVSDRIPSHDVCFVLDAGGFGRIRDGVKRSEFGTLVNIDHHFSNDRYGDYNLVIPEASATGEIVFRLIEALKVKVDKGIAESVYTSIVTDTGGFRYSNTTPQVLRLAAQLVDAGAEAQKVSERIFAGFTKEAMELIRVSLGTVVIHGDGRVASMTLTQEDLRKSGATDDDTENLINYVRKLDTVRIAVFLKERPDGQVKLSLRSRSDVNVANIANKFGGGGHVYAAGAVLSGPLDKALKSVLQACQQALR